MNFFDLRCRRAERVGRGDARRRAVDGPAQARRKPQGKPAVPGMGRGVAHRKIVPKRTRKVGRALARQREFAAGDTGLSDCLGHSSCVIGSGPFFRGSYAGNTAPVQPLCIRRNSVRSDLLDCGGDRKLPVLGWRNVLGALATILACCLGHDATDCFVRCTRDSEPDSYFDARRLID